MKNLIAAVAVLSLWAGSAEAQSARIPGTVRVEVRKAHTLGAMGVQGLAGPQTPGVGAQAVGAANANGPVVQAPVSRLENTTVIVGDQISISGRRW